MIRNPSKLDLVIMVGDIHTGNYSSSQEWFSNTKELFFKFIMPFVNYVKAKHPDRNVKLMLMGDFFDIKQSISVLIQSESITIMESLVELCEVMMIVGNHDMVTLENNEINSVKAFFHIDGVQVYTKPTIVETVSGEKILLMSYNKRKEKEKEIIDSHDADYLFAHTEIAGFHYEGVSVDESKHNHIEDFKKFKKVYSGHIHKKQSKENILFIGTPRQVRANEIDNENGIYLIDFKEQKEYYIENNVSPKFKAINIFSILNMKLSEANKFVENSYVTVICPSNLMYKLSPYKINQVLSGYKSISHDTPTTKANIDKDKLMLPELNSLDLQATSIEEKLVQYIEQLTSARVGKQFVQISDQTRAVLKDYTLKLYKAAESKVVDTEIAL
jgi:hypothetical protein